MPSGPPLLLLHHHDHRHDLDNHHHDHHIDQSNHNLSAKVKLRGSSFYVHHDDHHDNHDKKIIISVRIDDIKWERSC